VRRLFSTFPGGQLLDSFGTRQALLRAVGMHIGSRCKIPPPRLRAGVHLVELGDELVFGGGIHLQTFERCGGVVIFRKIKVGSSVVIGHSTLIGPGARLQEGVQLGAVAVVSPGQVLLRDTVYLGSPAIALGQVQSSRAISDMEQISYAETSASAQRTRNSEAGPHRRSICTSFSSSTLAFLQAAGVFARLVCRSCLSVLFIGPIILATRWVCAEASSVVVVSCVVFALVGFSFTCVVASLHAVKWLTIGSFIGNFEHKGLSAQAIFFIGSLHRLAWDMVLSWLQGTELYNKLLRALGARIGRGVLFDAVAPLELDALIVEDDAILDHTELAMHAVDNGRLQFASIRIGARSIVGCGTHLSPLVRLEQDVHVMPGTYVMKGSILPAGTAWVGNPPSEHIADIVRCKKRQ